MFSSSCCCEQWNSREKFELWRGENVGQRLVKEKGAGEQREGNKR